MMPNDFYSYIQGKDNKFREIRVIKRIPQEVLERRTKISQTKISQIDNGLAVPTEKEKRKLARALGVSVSEIWPNDSGLKRVTLLTERREEHGE